MLNKSKKFAKILKIIVAPMLFSQSSVAANFQLFEGSAVAVGNYGAGLAAEAVDASTAFYNPAGLVKIENQQLIGLVSPIISSLKFSGTSTWNTIPPVPFSYTQTVNGVNGGGLSFVPAIHYALPLGSNAAFGLSVVAPFGLATDWDETSAVRYAATRTKLEVIDLSPALAGKLTDKISLGAGIDLQYAKVAFNSIGGFPIAPQLPVPNTYFPSQFDSHSYNSAESLAAGCHIGILIEPTPTTRIGANYQSSVQHTFTGDSTLTGQIFNYSLFPPPFITGRSVTNSGLWSDLNLPATTTIGFYHDYNPMVAIMGTAIYTQWNSVRNITLNGISSATSTGVAFTPSIISTSVPQNLDNTWRASLGANLRAKENLLLRGGIGFDVTPTNDTDRVIRLPDSDRLGLAIGAQWRLNKQLGIDLGWTHLFMRKAPLHYTSYAGATAVTINGVSHNRADILAAQIKWDIT